MRLKAFFNSSFTCSFIAINLLWNKNNCKIRDSKQHRPKLQYKEEEKIKKGISAGRKDHQQHAPTTQDPYTTQNRQMPSYYNKERM